MLSACQWLEQTPVGAAVRQSIWLFPAIETLHLLGMIATIGTIAAFDLRLIGWVLPRAPISRLAAQLLPWVWAAFAVQVLTGSLLFSSEAVHMIRNPAFRLKLLLILLAGLNALVFHLVFRRNKTIWNEAGDTPVGARISASISLLLWTGVVAAGRWIGFL